MGTYQCICDVGFQQTDQKSHCAGTCIICPPRFQTYNYLVLVFFFFFYNYLRRGKSEYHFNISIKYIYRYILFLFSLITYNVKIILVSIVVPLLLHRQLSPLKKEGNVILLAY